MTMVMEKLNTTERGNRPGTHTCLDMSITDLENCLEGVKYPATKHDLVHLARRHGTSDDIMAFFRLLPEGKYSQFNDIAFMAWSFLLV